jgi:ATP-dependent Clp protease ATP-binding subunit ClpA
MARYIRQKTDWSKNEGMLEAVADEGKQKKIDPKELGAHMRSRVKGQEHIIDDCAKLIHLNMIKQQSNKPVASLLFLGPTGTGKTELAKAIAEYLFDDETAMVRFDCSEFTGSEAKARLVGMPGGYKDAEAGGQLTRAVMEKERRLILFDEIEKAHPSVFDLFLQLLGEARLTDQYKRETVNFSQCLIVLTSNAHAKEIGRIQEEITDYYEMVNAAKTHLAQSQVFRPEILGRIDRIYVFKPLEGMVIAEIALLKVSALAKEYGLTVQFVAPELIMKALISSAKMKNFGARELERVIFDMFAPQMAEARQNKVRSVNLAVNEAGELEVTPAFDP